MKDSIKCPSCGGDTRLISYPGGAMYRGIWFNFTQYSYVCPSCPGRWTSNEIDVQRHQTIQQLYINQMEGYFDPEKPVRSVLKQIYKHYKSLIIIKDWEMFSTVLGAQLRFVYRDRYFILFVHRSNQNYWVATIAEADQNFKLRSMRHALDLSDKFSGHSLDTIKSSVLPIVHKYLRNKRDTK